ncbi:MAG: hypothetical protein V2B15_09600 [Bacteroidota bacterium]
MSVRARFAQVIIPLAVEGPFTYAIPESAGDEISRGSRVLVPFGRKRIYSAVVSSLTDTPPEGFTPREIIEVLDVQPLVLSPQLQLWDWMAAYYMCSHGEVMRAALPSGLRPESESKVRINAGYDDDGSMDYHERLLFEVIKDQGEVTMGDLEMTAISERPLKVLKKLVEKGAVEINEFVRTLVRKQQVSYIRLSGSMHSENAIHLSLDRLSRAPRQKSILERYLQLAGPEDYHSEVPKTALTRLDGDAGALSSLIKKGTLVQVDREEMGKGSGEESIPAREPFSLNREQADALQSIRASFRNTRLYCCRG